MTYKAVFNGIKVVKGINLMQPGEIGEIVENPVGSNVGKLVACVYQPATRSQFKAIQLVDGSDAYMFAGKLKLIRARILQPGDTIEVLS